MTCLWGLCEEEEEEEGVLSDSPVYLEKLFGYKLLFKIDSVFSTSGANGSFDVIVGGIRDFESICSSLQSASSVDFDDSFRFFSFSDLSKTFSELNN